MRIIVLLIFLPTFGFSQANEEVIRKYLDDEIYFGEFELTSQVNERLTKEEYEFRRGFRKTYMNFMNDFGNVNGLPTSFELEDMTDFLMVETYIDMFEQFEELQPSDLKKFAEIAQIEPARFETTLKEAERFNTGWQNQEGTYQRSTWYVNSEGDAMILYFYLNEQQEIIEFQEDFLEL